MRSTSLSASMSLPAECLVMSVTSKSTTNLPSARDNAPPGIIRAFHPRPFRLYWNTANLPQLKSYYFKQHLYAPDGTISIWFCLFLFEVTDFATFEAFLKQISLRPFISLQNTTEWFYWFAHFFKILMNIDRYIVHVYRRWIVFFVQMNSYRNIYMYSLCTSLATFATYLVHFSFSFSDSCLR